MVALIGGVLKVTFGFLASKIRREILERLKDGDAVDTGCRDLIMSELEVIDGKLDGLARKDLLSSLCFLKEGINGLYQSLSQFKANENTAESTEHATLVKAASPRDIGLGSPINVATAFMNAIASSEIRSSERFKSAMKSFELAREKATEAFCNEALSIEYRIQASQFRMTARILEKLEDPNAGVSDCLQYLKQLHNIRAIQKTFSSLIDGGFKAIIKRAKLLNNATSVHLMNQLLFDFAGKYTSSPPRCFADWPMITFGERSYHPVFGEDSLVEELKESGVRVMSPYPDFTFGDKIFPPHSVVNSKGKIVAEMNKDNTIKIFQPSGSGENYTESPIFCEVPKEEHASLCRIVAMDIDAEDNLYVITGFQESDDQSWSFKLFVFDANGSKKLESPLPFLQNSSWLKLRMAVNKDGKIAILNCDEKMLYTGNVSVELNLKPLKVDNELSRTGRGNIRFSDFNGTEIIAADRMTVYIFTEDGQLQRKIKIPEEHGFITSVAINHSAKHILVKTSISTDRFSLLSYSETGKLIVSLCLCIDHLCLGSSKWIEYAKLTSHPNGAVALVGETGAALLQL